MTTETKLKRLFFARNRLLGDLEHNIATALLLERASKSLLIVCKDRTLERVPEKSQGHHVAHGSHGERKRIFNMNRAIEDRYHEAKVLLDDILPNSDDANATIDLSFIGGGSAAVEGGGLKLRDFIGPICLT